MNQRFYTSVQFNTDFDPDNPSHRDHYICAVAPHCSGVFWSEGFEEDAGFIDKLMNAES